ncbi:MAG: glutamate ligase domain-containing protein, partial [Prolixibacteraceae bacterium]
ELAKELKNTVSFGTKNAGFTGELVNSPPFVHVKVNFPKGVLYLNTNLTGSYNVENILAAACIGNFFEVDPLKIQKALREYQPSNNRSQLIQKGALKIVMDAYNANPTSMQASIKSFLSEFPKEEYTVVILGDMLELGEYALHEHTALLHEIQKYHVTQVYLVGPLFLEAAQNFPFKSFANVEQLCGHLKINPLKKGAVFIKGSRGIQLEKTLDCL